MTAMHKRACRLTAMTLCLCMLMSVANTALAEAAYVTPTGRGHTDPIMEKSRVADPDTMDDYAESDGHPSRLLSQTNGSRYAGRVWTDKTVFAYGDGNGYASTHFDGAQTVTLDMAHDGYTGEVNFDSDFLHVFSTLASSQVVNEYPPSPIDLVLVLDISSSMGDVTTPAAGTPWATIYTELTNYFETTASGTIESNTAFKDYYKKNHYLQYEFVLEWEQGGKTQTKTKTFESNEFPDELFSRGEANIGSDGKMYTRDTVTAFLDRYQVGGYTKRVVDGTGDHWEYTADPPEDGILNDNYRKIIGIQVCKDSKFWKSGVDGQEYTLAQAAALQAFEHTRFLNLIHSANNVIEQLMENNPENRVSVVVYDRRATVVMPLAHYIPNKLPVKELGPDLYDNKHLGKDAALGIIDNTVSELVYGYLCPFFDEHYDVNEKSEYVSGNVDVSSAYVVATPKDTVAADGTTPLTDNRFCIGGDFRIAGTNTHAGMTAGMEQLANAQVTTLTETLSTGQASTVPRIPAIVIMTDGGSNTVANGPWYDPDYATPVQRSDHKNDWSSVVVSQYLLTAAYLKSAVEKNYNLYMNLGPSQSLPVYTVGVDLRDDTDDWVPARLYPMLDPEQYFKDAEHIPLIAEHPEGDGIALGSDGTNKDLIDTAYQTLQSWSADPDPAKDVTLEFEVAQSTESTPGRFQQNEDKSSHTYDPYIIPFEQDEENRSGDLKPWTGTLGGKEYALQYNTAWHGWATAPNETTDPHDLPVNFGANITGTATLWSFNEAFKTAGETGTAYEAGGNQYKATYLAERSVEYNDTNDADAPTQIRYVAPVTQDDITGNIHYVTEFYNVSSAQMGAIFDQILKEVLGQVFVPISGSNDAGVGDSITYQDPLGQYMDVKNQSIQLTPHHIDGSASEEEGAYDMALLLFGELHGLVRTGIYDFQWNDEWMDKHGDGKEIIKGTTPFPSGWYKADASADDPNTEKVSVGKNGLPVGCDTAEDAWNNGYVYRLNNQALTQYVPIVADADAPDGLIDQAKNTVYTLYRFAGTEENRNKLRRNPVYGDVPQELEDGWNQIRQSTGAYPAGDDYYSGAPGVYRLSDIRVWVEDTGDFVDTTGAFTPETGYDRSLYLNIPAAAVPTELATITLGPDGVLSYGTNLPADHDYADEYCRQSTPLRLFYAVGLEDDLILRDESGNQTGVDISALSREYVEAHTDAQDNSIWFYSNYYSNTPFGEYVTDDQQTRTRGDPTITFSPSIENRYYVFQKPLPLFAHAYRVQEDGSLTPVDKADGGIWTDEERAKGNGAIPEGATTPTWETVDGVQQRPGAWVGGLYMGVYADEKAFSEAYDAAKNTADRKIADANKTQYPLVEGGIVFLQSDLMTDAASGSANPLSSNNYYFLLVEYYLPDGGAGKDRGGDDVPGTQEAHAVQRVVARKGSEFGSAFQSEEIGGGDMLCWTNVGHPLDVEFAFLSPSQTGDSALGRPTWQTLTLTGEDLEKYLLERGISPDAAAPDPENPGKTVKILAYWEKMQANPLVKTALAKADTNNNGEVSEQEFKDYFNFAVAARPGGIRTGDMASNRLTKSANPTGTANSYYLPAVSDHSGTDNDVILDNYLGNNGRLAVVNSTLLVTKLLEATPGMALPADSDKEAFLYQLYVQGVTGTQSATRVYYDPLSDTWRRRVAYIDVLTDNSDLLQTRDGARALFDLSGGTARHVVPSGGRYYYANEDGTPGREACDTPLTSLYYLYLPPNTGSTAAGETSAHARRLYQDDEYEGSDKLTSLNDGNRLTVYYAEGQTDPGSTDTVTYTQTTDAVNRPAGTQAFWAQLAELIPVSEVNAVTGEEGWQHSSENHTSKDHVEKISYTLVVSKPASESSASAVSSPFLTRSAYLSKEIVFGKNANEMSKEGDAGKHAAGTDLQPDDLYDTVIPTGDRPDLFNAQEKNATLDEIAANTAEFTLQSGQGLLLTGLANGLAYRYTEKLTDAQLAAGYTLKQLAHVQQRGSESVYKPGAQQIPVYAHDGATYGPYYPLPDAPTQDGLTWAVNRRGQPNDSSYLTYEPFYHTNAVLWAHYATLAAAGSGSVGGHHHRADAAVTETAPFFNQSVATGSTHEVLPNPSCAACDVPVLGESGNVVGYQHYVYRDGQLVDPHYEGEASAYLQRIFRCIVSPSVHFAVKDEARPDAAYTGVYSAFGDTGSFEEQSHYVNTVVKNALSVEKRLVEDADSPLTVAERGTEFAFTLSLQGADGSPLDGSYPYVITQTDETGADEVLTHGVLYAVSPNEGVDNVKEGAKANIQRGGDGLWRFALKGGQTFTVSGLPETKYAYTVAEAPRDGFTPDRETAAGTVDPGATGVVTVNQETFFNRKQPPEPVQVDLPLTKTLIDPCGKYDWRANPFLFAVMPSPRNSPDDPVRRLPGYDAASNLYTLRTGNDAFAAGQSAVLTVFDKLTYARAGSYCYTIFEQIPAAPAQGMRYDSAVYQVTVDVKPDGDDPGRLAATVTIAEGGRPKELVAFENHCDRPPDLPLTGDDSPVALWLALAALCGLAMCALCAASGKRRASRDR